MYFIYKNLHHSMQLQATHVKDPLQIQDPKYHQNMSDSLLFTLALSIAIAILISSSFAWHYIGPKTQRNSPPSPRKLLVVGNLHQVGHLMHRSLYQLSKKHGPLMLLHLGSKPMLVVSSAEAAKQILKTHDLAFADRPALKDLRKVFYDMKDPINLPYGERWRKLRSIVVHHLLSSSRVKSFASIREQETALLVSKIEDHRRGSCVNLTEMFAELSNDFISLAALGEKHSETENGKKFLEHAEEAVGLLFNFSAGEFVPWLSWVDRLSGKDAALDRILKIRDEVFDAIIQDHLKSRSRTRTRTHNNNNNIIDILLGIYMGHIPAVSIDLTSVKAVVFDIFVAGTETTSTALVWTMTELMRHPATMKKLQDEIRGVMKMKGKQAGEMMITEDDLLNMQYLKAVIKETLRLRPPLAFFFHESRERVNLMGYEIAPKTTVFINAWAIGQDPACWDEPEKFMPERFLTNSHVDLKGFDFQFIPFGAGRRICPGIGFATAALEHTIANLMLKFDWTLPDQANLDVTERPGFSIRKKTPLVVVATPHSFGEH